MKGKVLMSIIICQINNMYPFLRDLAHLISKCNIITIWGTAYRHAGAMAFH